MKKIAIIAAMGAAFATAGVQAAANGTINFTGSVVSQTCNATTSNASSGSPATVALPTVSTSQLATAGSTAGTTSFVIAVTGCNSTNAQGSTNVKAFFEKGTGNNVDSSGRLNNTASGGANNVALQLLDGSNSNSVINVGDAAQSTGSNGYVAISGGTANLPYAVRYVATAAAATAGTVTSNVTYSLVYN